MTKLQAAMRDAAHGRAHSGRHYYRVGSVFKSCANCESFDVYRSYDPKGIGWTWWCYVCGAKDLVAWAPDDAGFVEVQLGKPASFKTRDERDRDRGDMLRKVRERAAQQKRDAGGEVPRALQITNADRSREISNIKDELDKLRAELAQLRQ